MTHKKILTLFIPMAALICWNTSNASCRFKEGTGSAVVMFAGTGRWQAIEPGLPINTVLFSTSASVSRYPVVICSGNSPSGVIPRYSNPAAGERLFRLGTTGLSFSIEGTDGNLLTSYGTTSLGEGMWGYTHTRFTLRVIKTGKIDSVHQLPSGQIATQSDGGVDSYIFKTTTNSGFYERACEVQPVVVDMGSHYIHEVYDSSGDSLSKSFSVSITECPKSTKGMTFSLKPLTQVIDGSSGVISLNKASNAKNIGIQITDDSGKAITFDKDYPLSSRDSQGTFIQTLSAKYINLGTGPIKAGTANSEIMFLINYL
ncbi:fimbrial protein [Pseudomonas sp. NPDC087639]|uniref:fimbrial protein n=1 Tax=Pseudomonas sp. NPDC087639 TaxID=3364445 RepID=UPI0037FF67C1